MTHLYFEQLHYHNGTFSINANLCLEGGKRYVLHAPSGSGKSTFLDLIAGFIQPQSGNIRYDSQTLSMLNVEQRPVSYLFQQHNLFDHLTIQNNLKLANQPHTNYHAIMDSVGLSTQYLKKYPNQLSGGEQQRVALARTLLLERPIVLLDEPFSALDHSNKQHVMDLTKTLQIQQKWLLIAVSHDTNDITALDAQALTIDNQQVIFSELSL